MKIHNIWSKLTTEQKRSLRKWVASPYHNTRQDVIDLYEYLRQNDQTVENLDKNALFKVLYGDVSYNDNWIRRVYSLLVKAIAQFLLYEKIDADTQLKSALLADIYQDLRLEKLFVQHYEEMKQEIGHTTLRDEKYLNWCLTTEKTWFEHHAQQQRNENNNLQSILDAQEKAFAADKMRMICTAISYQNVYKLSYDFGLVEPLLQQIEAKGWHLSEPAIGAYYYIYKMNRSENGEAYFETLCQNLPYYRQCFSKKESSMLYLGTINHTIKYCNTGNTRYFRTLYQLYKEGIESGVLISDKGELSPYTYKNLVATGLRVGEHDYIEIFITDYKDFLPLEQRKNYHEYNLARFYFVKNDFTKAMPLLNKLTYGDIFLQLDAKVMLLKMYYETEEYDILDTFLRSFQQFIQRKRAVLSYHYQNYFNIIYFTKQLIVCDILDKKEKNKLCEQITETQPLTEREWLLNKIKQQGIY